jgi:glycosyltransferase involved in cell wall biosynthesis
MSNAVADFLKPLHRVSAPGETIAGRGVDLLCARDMLCFSHDWTGDPLSKTHLMRLLARKNRILWVNSIGYRTPTVSKADMGRALRKLKAVAAPVREVEKNIFVLNPLAVPFYGPVGRALNRRLLAFQVRAAMRRLGFQRPINWVFNPAAASVAGHLSEDLIIYYCVDEYTAFSGVSSASVADLEQRLLQRADAVIVSADKLLESKAPFNPHTILIRHGVDFNHFRKALDPQLQVPLEIANLPRPIIGFFGLIADWVDVDIMAAIARHFSSGSLVVLGKATTDVTPLKALTNAHLLGRKPYEQLPAYCKGFDVAINPFRINELTLNANPLKVREYLAAGLPVVSTDIPEVKVLGLCRLANNVRGFIQEIELALQDPGPTAIRSDAIRHESWEARLQEIGNYLESLQTA